MVDLLHDLWWNKITGPSYLVSSVVNAYEENKSVILLIPSDIPWRAAMRAAVCARIREMLGDTNVTIQEIDVEDQCRGENPGQYILDTYSSRETRNDYRSSSKSTIQEYIINRNVLKDTILWVKGVGKEDAKSWIDFCAGYNPKEAHKGMVVLELRNNTAVKLGDSVPRIDYDAYVSRNDVHVFSNYLLFDDSRYTRECKEYIAVLLSKLCDKNGEIASRLAEFNLMEVEIEDAFSQIADSETEEASSVVQIYVRNYDRSKIAEKKWSAQVQSLFPIIEQKRLQIVQNNEWRIQEMLNNRMIIQYDVRITDPTEVELGTMAYMISKYSLFGDRKLISEIRFLHDCRNKIAHGNCCPISDVEKLLSNIPN